MPAQTVIREAAEVYKLAQPIIHKHHSELRYARILWLFSSAKRTKGGKVQLGSSKKLSPEARFLSSGNCSVEDGYDFLITLSEGRWRVLSEEQRKALIDHELCHCQRKETVNRRTGKVTVSWYVRGHDLEEFVEIVERHGLWNHDVANLVQAAPRQLEIQTYTDEANEGLPVVPAGGTEADSAPSSPPSEAPASDAEVEALKGDLDEIIAQSDEPAVNGQVSEKFIPYEERSSEELAAGRPDGDWFDDEADAETVTLESTNGRPLESADVPAERNGNWREATGIGSSEHEKRRRSRTRA